jgi:hypothetical protein
MGAGISADTNINIQEIVSKTMNEFITENSAECNMDNASAATVEVSGLTCGRDIIIGATNAQSDADIKVKCLQANTTEQTMQTFADNKLKSKLEKETKNTIGILEGMFKVSADQKKAVQRDIQEIVNKVKTTNTLTCLTTNLSTADAIIKNHKAGRDCIVNDINAIASSSAEVECIQKNKTISKAVTKLQTTMDSIISKKKDNTIISIIFIVVGGVVGLIVGIFVIYLMFRRRSVQQPYGGMQQPYGGMQQPYGGMQQPYGGMQQPYGGM